MELFFVDGEEKCGCCSCNGNLYALADTKEEAEILYKNGDAGLCGDCIVEMLMEKYKITKKEETQTETCNECGRSVIPGSGNFVNRVPDCNTVEERKEMGKPYPEGDYMCAECDNK